MPASPRLFLFLGLILIILAAIVLPAKMMLAAQPIDPDPYNVGWLFSPVMGGWGLFSATIGLVQSSWPKQKIGGYLWIIFGLAFVVMMFIFLILGSLISSLIRAQLDVQLFWFSYAILTLIPCKIVIALSAVYLRRKEEKGSMRVNKKVKVAAFTTSIVVPLLYSVALYYSLTMPRPV